MTEIPNMAVLSNIEIVNRCPRGALQSPHVMNPFQAAMLWENHT
jgi:hypothetical protein